MFKLNCVILDQTYGYGVNGGGHLNAEQVEKIIEKMKKEQIIDDTSLIYVTHLSHEGNDIHEKMEKRAVGKGYHVAYDGLCLEL